MKIVLSDDGIQELIESEKLNSYILQNIERIMDIDYEPTDVDLTLIDNGRKYFLHNFLDVSGQNKNYSVSFIEPVRKTRKPGKNILLNFSIPELDISKYLKTTDEKSPKEILSILRKKPGVRLQEDSDYNFWIMRNNNPGI